MYVYKYISIHRERERVKKKYLFTWKIKSKRVYFMDL